MSSPAGSMHNFSFLENDSVVVIKFSLDSMSLLFFFLVSELFCKARFFFVCFGFAISFKYESRQRKTAIYQFALTVLQTRFTLEEIFPDS